MPNSVVLTGGEQVIIPDGIGLQVTHQWRDDNGNIIDNGRVTETVYRMFEGDIYDKSVDFYDEWTDFHHIPHDIRVLDRFNAGQGLNLMAFQLWKDDQENVIQQSGFTIVKIIKPQGNNTFGVTITKEPAFVDIDRIQTEAGLGQVQTINFTMQWDAINEMWVLT